MKQLVYTADHDKINAEINKLKSKRKTWEGSKTSTKKSTIILFVISLLTIGVGALMVLFLDSIALQILGGILGFLVGFPILYYLLSRPIPKEQLNIFDEKINDLERINNLPTPFELKDITDNKFYWSDWKAHLLKLYNRGFVSISGDEVIINEELLLKKNNDYENKRKKISKKYYLKILMSLMITTGLVIFLLWFDTHGAHKESSPWFLIGVICWGNIFWVLPILRGTRRDQLSNLNEEEEFSNKLLDLDTSVPHEKYFLARDLEISPYYLEHLLNYKKYR